MELLKSVIEKVSSYNLFNYFFPGILFCFIVSCTTRFSLMESQWEYLFIYYFVGMLISRIGSLVVERCLMTLKVKNKKTKEKESYLKLAPYEKYLEAMEKDSQIAVLNETNNVYRTMIAVFVVALFVKLYDWLLYDFIRNCWNGGINILIILIGLGIILIFVKSYKKQTDYIRNRVTKCTKSIDSQAPSAN